MCVLTMLKISENNGTGEIGLVTPTPDCSDTPQTIGAVNLS